jgi:hypothetical protein
MHCPIIYVRGYAGLQDEVEQAVDDPFCGFNTGSTHVRQDDTGDPEFYVFESPLIRLISDDGYSEVFNGFRQELTDSCKDPVKTIWIHRYYDQTKPLTHSKQFCFASSDALDFGTHPSRPSPVSGWQ